MSLTPRERVSLTLSLKEPDRVPIDIGSTAANFTNPVYFKLKKYFRITGNIQPFRPTETAGFYDDRILKCLGTDFRHLFLLPPSNFKIKYDAEGCFYDEWGIKKKKVGDRIEIIDSPLARASVSDLDNYPWPNPYDPARVKNLEERAQFLWEKTNYAIAARAVSHGFFELAWELRGMENFLIDMILNKRFANALLDKTLQIQIGLYDVLLTKVGKYIQIVETADDYGSQNGPLISPELFREMIKPRRKKLNDFIRSRAPQVKILHHTCGSVYELIEDLIETGIDILNPVQPLAKNMDSFKLKHEFGNRLCFHGGIDEQQAIPGPLDKLEEEIIKRINSFAPGGGYILAPTSNFQVDTPIENILFLVEKAKKYGRYPIKNRG